MTVSPSVAREPGARLTRRGLIAAIACISVVAMALTLTQPLLALLLERRGASGTGIGLNSAMSAIAILITPLTAPKLLRRLGVPLFMGLCLLLSAACLISMKLWPNYWWWSVARFFIGAAVAGLFVGSEFWIVASASPRIRGRIVAIYAVALSIGYALGPLILTAVGVDGWAPFLTAVALTAMAGAPLIAAWRDAPVIETSEHSGVLRFFVTDPSVLFAVVLFGLVEFGVMALVPVWGVRLGMLEATAITLTAALAIGNVALQPPLGWAADRFPARPLLLLAALACLAAAVLLPFASGSFWSLYPLMFLWGGLAAGLYTIALTAIGGRYEGGDLADANAAIASAYGLGALVGPLSVGAAMDAAGPHGLSLALGLSAGLYCLLVLLRLRNG